MFTWLPHDLNIPLSYFLHICPTPPLCNLAIWVCLSHQPLTCLTSVFLRAVNFSGPVFLVRFYVCIISLHIICINTLSNNFRFACIFYSVSASLSFNLSTTHHSSASRAANLVPSYLHTAHITLKSRMPNQSPTKHLHLLDKSVLSNGST